LDITIFKCKGCGGKGNPMYIGICDICGSNELGVKHTLSISDVYNPDLSKYVKNKTNSSILEIVTELITDFDKLNLEPCIIEDRIRKNLKSLSTYFS